MNSVVIEPEPRDSQAVMSSDAPRMPDPVESNSFIPTLDRQGAVWLYIDEITEAYGTPEQRGRLREDEHASGSGECVEQRRRARRGGIFHAAATPGFCRKVPRLAEG